MNQSSPARLVFKPPGSAHNLTVSFPTDDLPVCKKCKSAFKSRKICRITLGHTTPPWTPAYICITLNDSCIKQETSTGNKNDDSTLSTLVVPSTPKTEHVQQLVECPFDVSNSLSKHVSYQQFTFATTIDTSMPCCVTCKSSSRSKFACRALSKHIFLPWNTVFVTASVRKQADTYKDEPQQNRSIIQQSQFPASGTNDIDIPISKQSQDIRNVRPSRTFLIEVSFSSISLQWLNVKTAQLTHGGGGAIAANIKPMKATTPKKKKKKKFACMVINESNNMNSHGNPSIPLKSLPSFLPQQQVTQHHNIQSPGEKHSLQSTSPFQSPNSDGEYDILRQEFVGPPSIPLNSLPSFLPQQQVTQRHNIQSPGEKHSLQSTSPFQSRNSGGTYDILRQEYVGPRTNLASRSNHHHPNIVPALGHPSRFNDLMLNRPSIHMDTSSVTFPWVPPYSFDRQSIDPSLMLQGSFTSHLDPSLTMFHNDALYPRNIHPRLRSDSNNMIEQILLHEENRRMQERMAYQIQSRQDPHVHFTSAIPVVPMTGVMTATSSNPLRRQSLLLSSTVQDNENLSNCHEMNAMNLLLLQQQQPRRPQSFAQHFYGAQQLSPSSCGIQNSSIDSINQNPQVHKRLKRD